MVLLQNCCWRLWYSWFRNLSLRILFSPSHAERVNQMQTLNLHCQKVELCTRSNVQNSSIGNLMITRREDVMLLSAITIVGCRYDMHWCFRCLLWCWLWFRSFVSRKEVRSESPESVRPFVEWKVPFYSSSPPSSSGLTIPGIAWYEGRPVFSSQTTWL